MAVASNIKTDLLPLQAGIVRLIPINAFGVPDYKLAVTTKRNFLTSTQVTVSRTADTLANGNGGDKNYTTGEIYNLALITNIYDPNFHSVAAGMARAVVAESDNMLYDTSFVVPSEIEYQVTLKDHLPVKSDDGKYHFEIRDSFGNALEQVDGVPEAGQFQYEDSGHILKFNEDSKGKLFSCVYYVAATGGVVFKANATPGNPVFQIEVYAEMRSADNDETVLMMEKMLRGTLSGDLPNAMTQKSVSAPLTYNFTSAPAPQGMSPFTQVFKTPENSPAA